MRVSFGVWVIRLWRKVPIGGKARLPKADKRVRESWLNNRGTTAVRSRDRPYSRDERRNGTAPIIGTVSVPEEMRGFSIYICSQESLHTQERSSTRSGIRSRFMRGAIFCAH